MVEYPCEYPGEARSYGRSPVMAEYPCEARSTLLGRYPAESSEVGEHWLLRTEH